MKKNNEIFEKVLLGGLWSVSDREAIYLALKPGLSHQKALNASERIIRACDGNIGRLKQFSCSGLSHASGLSLERASSFISAMSLSRRAAEERPTKISRSSDIAQLMSFLNDCAYEEFWVVLLTRSNNVTHKVKISEGGISGTVVDPKKIAHEAVIRRGSALVLVHNHPSGNIFPSEADKAITTKVRDGLALLDISVLDHVIIGDSDKYYSFADEGLI